MELGVEFARLHKLLAESTVNSAMAAERQVGGWQEALPPLEHGVVGVPRRELRLIGRRGRPEP